MYGVVQIIKNPRIECAKTKWIDKKDGWGKFYVSGCMKVDNIIKKTKIYKRKSFYFIISVEQWPFQFFLFVSLYSMYNTVQSSSPIYFISF